MFVIQIEDVINILSTYSCNVNVKAIEMLSYFQEDEKVCIVISATTDSDKKYVIKLLNIEPINIGEEEKRNAFSEFLRSSGLPIPKKYACNDNYCTVTQIDNFKFLATVEDYFGEDVKEITCLSAYELGSMLGKMHYLSYNEDYHLTQGYVQAALKSERTNFDSIWKNLDTIVFDSNDDIQKLKVLHNNKIEELKQIWHELPTVAVHGDLGLTSNLMYQNNGYGIIDFNLAGDEVLLGDLLITWYSSRYSNDFLRKVPVNDINTVRNSFVEGYRCNRKLLPIENKYYNEVANTLNGIYFNRFVANLAKDGNIVLAKELSKNIYKHYFIDEIILNLKQIIV